MSLENVRFNLFVDEVITRLGDVSNAVKRGDTFTRTAESQYLQGLIWGAQLGGMITTDQWGLLGSLITDTTYPEDGIGPETIAIGPMVESLLPERLK